MSLKRPFYNAFDDDVHESRIKSPYNFQFSPKNNNINSIALINSRETTPTQQKSNTNYLLDLDYSIPTVSEFELIIDDQFYFECSENTTISTLSTNSLQKQPEKNKYQSTLIDYFRSPKNDRKPTYRNSITSMDVVNDELNQQEMKCHICTKQVSDEVLTRKCNYCWKVFCIDACGGNCFDCQQIYCKFCVVMCFERRYDCLLCLDCNK